MRDTVESCITWERYLDFQAKVKEATLRAIAEVTGRPGSSHTSIRTALLPTSPGTHWGTRRS